MLQKTIWLQISIFIMVTILVFQISSLIDRGQSTKVMSNKTGAATTNNTSVSLISSDKSNQTMLIKQSNDPVIRHVSAKELVLAKTESHSSETETDITVLRINSEADRLPETNPETDSDISLDNVDQEKVLSDFRVNAVSLDVYANQDGFSCQMELMPQIGYFNGKTNLQGRNLPNSPKRLLGRETLLISLRFSEPPSRIELSLGSASILLYGHPGRSVYTVTLRAPAEDETLNWSNQRLADPLALVLSATPYSNAQNELIAELQGIEITGHVRHLVHVQPVRSP